MFGLKLICLVKDYIFNYKETNKNGIITYYIETFKDLFSPGHFCAS